jgi:hypothetical protein
MLWFSSTKVTPAERQARALERMALATEVLAEQAELIYASLNDVSLAIDAIGYCLNRPGVPRVVFLKEAKEYDMKKIIFEVTFAPEMDPTTVQREMSVQVGTDPPDVRTVGVEVLKVDGFKAPVDTPVHIEQTDIDDVGNRSAPAVLDVTVKDTFPPAQPGSPSVVATGEVNED